MHCLFVAETRCTNNKRKRDAIFVITNPTIYMNTTELYNADEASNSTIVRNIDVQNECKTNTRQAVKLHIKN
jgi:hypothetical protein